MQKSLRAVLALLLLASLAVPIVGQVSYNECWSDCHDLAMVMYEQYGMLDAATDAFHGCMEMLCPAPT